MKKKFCFYLPLLFLTACTTSNTENSIDFRHQNHQTNKPENLFFPDLESSEWIPLKLYNQNKIKAFILLNSITTSSDLSIINYYINIKTLEGFNNLSAESMNCINKSYQIIAVGDVDNKTWLYQKNQLNKTLDTGKYAVDEVRSKLYEHFCHGIFPNNKIQLKNQLKQ